LIKTAEAGGECGFDGGKLLDGRKRQFVVDMDGMPGVDESYRGDTIEWMAKMLGITIEIVTHAVDQVGFPVQLRRSLVERMIASS
jgi:hypothetical protein